MTRLPAALLVVVALLATTALTALAAPPARARPSTGLPAQAAPAGDGLVWSSSQTPDVLGAFLRSDFNEQGGAPEVVASPTGGQSVRFSVPEGGERSEVLPRIAKQQEGDELVFGYHGALAPDFTADADAFQILMQWHQDSDDGSPPVSVSVENGMLTLTGGGNAGNESYDQALAPVGPGDDLRLVLRIHFSRDPGRASIDAWYNGRRVLTDFHPPSGTLYDDSDYMKVGLYRDTSLTGTASVRVDEVAVGTSWAPVARRIDYDGDEGAAPPPGQDADTPPSTTGSSSTSVALSVGAGVAALLVVLLVLWGRRGAGRAGPRHRSFRP